MKIITVENRNNEKFLRKGTADFKFDEFEKRDLRELVQKMKRVMKEANGIGLSANQVGIGKKFFVAQITLYDENGIVVREKFYAVFNPKITKESDKTVAMEEGCLSVPGTYGQVLRPEKIVLEGFNQNGGKIKIRASGLLARVLQHEMDHLQGKLFIDKMKETKNDN